MRGRKEPEFEVGRSRGSRPGTTPEVPPTKDQGPESLLDPWFRVPRDGTPDTLPVPHPNIPDFGEVRLTEYFCDRFRGTRCLRVEKRHRRTEPSSFATSGPVPSSLTNSRTPGQETVVQIGPVSRDSNDIGVRNTGWTPGVLPGYPVLERGQGVVSGVRGVEGSLGPQFLRSGLVYLKCFGGHGGSGRTFYDPSDLFRDPVPTRVSGVLFRSVSLPFPVPLSLSPSSSTVVHRPTATLPRVSG